jgi:hypothetical protein
VSGDSYGPLLWYLILDFLGAAQEILHPRVPDGAHDLFVARPNDLLGKILAHFYLHFPTVKSWAMRPFARPAVFADPT